MHIRNKCVNDLNMSKLKNYIVKRQQGGKVYFTSDEALSDLSLSNESFRVSLHRLRKEGLVISPVHGLHIILSPQHQMVGCIPAEDFIPILMSYWNLDYYAGLLTAAMYHGASHQKPQVFQVITPRQLRPLQMGRIKIQFIRKLMLENLPINSRTVSSGYLKIASPELTAYDLLHYPNQCGGINNIATTLSELIEAMQPNDMKDFLDVADERVWVQRFGFILQSIETFEETKKNDLIEVLKTYLGKHPLHYAPLVSGIPFKGCQRNKIWKIIENTIIESDL